MQANQLPNTRYRTVVSRNAFEDWREAVTTMTTMVKQQISSGLMLVDDDHNIQVSQSVLAKQPVGRRRPTKCLTPQSSAVPGQGKPQGKHTCIHARRAASENERAIRGVGKTKRGHRGRSSGQGDSIGGRRVAAETPERRKPRRKRAGVRRVVVRESKVGSLQDVRCEMLVRCAHQTVRCC